MKRFCVLLSLILALSLFFAAAQAEEAVEAVAEEAVEEIVEEAAEAVEEDAEPEAAPVPETVFSGTLMGQWYGTHYSGDYSMSISGEFFYLPNGTILTEDGYVIQLETKDDTHFTFALPEEFGLEGVTLSAETGTLTQAMIEEYSVSEVSYIDSSIGAPCIIVSVTGMDNSNPLAPVEITTTSLFLKYTRQDDYLELLMAGKTWKIGDNTLVIDAEGNLNLNDGAATGSVYWSYNDETPLYVNFYWSSGADIYYIPTEVTVSSITLVNRDNESEVVVLEYQGEAPAVEAPAEEPAEEAPEEAPEAEVLD